jgi:predicted ABC-type ATPase
MKVKGKRIDFGYYINADDIAGQLRTDSFTFNSFRLKVSKRDFHSVALASGLVNTEFTQTDFIDAHSFRSNKVKLKDIKAVERVAQIIADFLRKKLLNEKQKFSFETVFSHHSKLDIMREAVAEGYKVYLYFVSTESPDINIFRVEARKKLGGHDVPRDKIVSRYYRSLDFLYEACQLAYQVFFFDNSEDGQDSIMFAHFKKEKDVKKWDRLNKKKVPVWFRKYYSDKVSK